ncbi:hypothetical protein ACH5RR_040936 [Cinchona calisaya]|uniref:Endonuclease/exonuclease/phosphatase domain-containing protein n=1 Tax=Cinchona calisaya TaxID=153742 RepID=A0ABD2XVC5_9GENT
MLIRIHNIPFLAIMEPKLDIEHIFPSVVGFSLCLINCNSKICVFWTIGYHYNVLENNEQLLHLDLTHDGWTFSGFVTLIYVQRTRRKRQQLWADLDRLALASTRPWLWGGDFNTISSLVAYSRASQQHLRAIENFNSAAYSCDMQEINYTGSAFTRSGTRNGRIFHKRLDRILANQAWLE